MFNTQAHHRVCLASIACLQSKTMIQCKHCTTARERTLSAVAAGQRLRLQLSMILEPPRCIFWYQLAARWQVVYLLKSAAAAKDEKR